MIYQFQNVRGFKKRRLRKSDIVLIQADANYTTFYLKTGKTFTLAKTMKECEGIFYDANFVRSHRSYMVNIDYLKSMGKHSLNLENNLTAKVSRRKRKELPNQSLQSGNVQIQPHKL